MTTSLDRRVLLQRLGIGLAALPLVTLACGGGSESDDATDATDTSDSVDGDDTVIDAAPGVDGTSGAGDAAAGSEWASGGTAAMTGKASYPDPFTAGLATCAIVASTTEGPCTTPTSANRQDVSEAWAGIPVRLGIKVVDSSCNPVVGATVNIWHTNKEGIYSGNTPNHGMCNANNATYIAASFMRGTQITDASGVVYFDTCFPGWYNGRAIHVHFQVKSGSTTYKISQLFFPEATTSAIFASHPDYSSYGPPNTTFANDMVLSGVPAAGRARLIMDVARMSDGAMLASKTVTVV